MVRRANWGQTKKVILRYLTWVLAGLFVPLAPYLAIYFSWSTPVSWAETLTGRGQFLLTGVAVVAGGVKELHLFDHQARNGPRIVVGLASLVYCIFTAALYGIFIERLANTSPVNPVDMTAIAQKSLQLLAVGLVIGFAAITVTFPATDNAPTSTSANMPRQGL